MLKIFLALIVAVMSFAFSAEEAEAARFGGRRSFGMQRQAVSPRPVPTAPAAAPGVAPRRSFMGPIAGLAAGLGIAALFSHLGLGAGFANFLTLALLVMAAVAIFKWLARKSASAAPPAEPLRYAGLDPNQRQAQPMAMPASGGSSGAAELRVPAGFDSEAFLRIAKLNFVRLQTANDEKDIDDIREFVSPEVFAEIKMQLDERGDAPQQTDVVTLNAELLEVVTEGNRHIASVHFSGMIRETADSAAEPFAEVWNLSKPIEGNKGWVISGIQQLS